MQRMLKSEQGIAALKTLKAILLGGSAIPSVVMAKAIELQLNAYVSYGLTEMGSQVATGRIGQCVRVLPGRELMVNPKGEILVKGNVLFKGYIQSGRIHLPLVEGGWFATGDRGVLDDQGCLSVLGRVDHMFISAGENIQPEEIEKVLLSHPAIEEAIVLGQEDGDYGFKPVAFVRSNAHVSAEELTAFCRKFLPGIKVPKTFHPWPHDLPQSIKVSRQELRKHL